MRRLIIGGARSGKSRFAESLLMDAPAVDYVATSQRRTDDAEWEARVAAHVARRPATWNTVETLDLPEVLAEGAASVLVDCLTVWLTRVMDECGCWAGADAAQTPPPAHDLAPRLDALVAATRATTRDVIFVTNEVGQGIVPATASGRLFRDEMGILNVRMAAVCDEVWLVTAGIPQRIKGTP